MSGFRIPRQNNLSWSRQGLKSNHCKKFQQSVLEFYVLPLNERGNKLFSLNRPRPIQSGSHNVKLSVCLSVPPQLIVCYDPLYISNNWTLPRSGHLLLQWPKNYSVKQQCRIFSFTNTIETILYTLLYNTKVYSTQFIAGHYTMWQHLNRPGLLYKHPCY